MYRIRDTFPIGSRIDTFGFALAAPRDPHSIVVDPESVGDGPLEADSELAMDDREVLALDLVLGELLRQPRRVQLGFRDEQRARRRLVEPMHGEHVG